MPVKKEKKQVSKKLVPKTHPKAAPAVPKPTVSAMKPKPQLLEYFYANGKRKTAVSRVRLYKNDKGAFTVNDRSFENFFPLSYHQQVVHSPFKITSLDGKFSMTAKVFGGGMNAQAEAIRHGISKALLNYDPGLRSTLKRAGYLTRDARVKERKKPGLHRARRAPQFSKR